MSDRDIAAAVAEHLRNQARQAGWVSNPAGWARDVLGVHMWSKQQEISSSVVSNKRTVVASCHGTGKALHVDTPIPVPGGYKAMGDLRPGSKVLGLSGEPVSVVAVTGEHMRPSWCVLLRGPGGQEAEIIASGEHVWPVLDSSALRKVYAANGRSDQATVHTGLWAHLAREVTTEKLADLVATGRSLMVPGEAPQVDAVYPVWKPDRLMRAMFHTRGHVDGLGRASLVWIAGESQHRPDGYPQARAWFQDHGVPVVMGSRIDGSVEWRTMAIGGSTAASLLPDENDRALAYSALADAQGIEPHSGWRVAAVTPWGEQPVQCIEVDAEDHLFLCGLERIPTHNSMIASVLACWWISTHPIGEAIVVSTAPTYAQVNKILWEEIRKHHSTAKRRGTPMVGYVTQGDEWKTADGQILAFGRKPATGDRHGFQGIHRKYVLAIGDEACGLPEEIWTGIEAITTGDSCRMLYIGNPDDRVTEFGNAFLDPKLAKDWNRISVPASSTPNFTGEEVPALLNEVLVSKAWAEDRLRAWGEEDPRYISKVKAEFPEQSKSSLFPPALVASAFEETPPAHSGGVLRLGVDVARFGTDLNVVVSHMGVTARVEDSWSGTDTVSSAHRVLKLAEDLKEQFKASWVEIRVDAVGLGAGVVDTLNARSVLLLEPWFSVYEMHGSASPPVDVGGSVHGYGNARAFWFDQLRQQMRNGRVRMVEHAQLRDDLAIVFYQFRNGRLFIVSKEDMRKEHGRSPDYADAMAYATAPVAEGMPMGSTVSDPADAVLADLDDLDDMELSIGPF